MKRKLYSFSIIGLALILLIGFSSGCSANIDESIQDVEPIILKVSGQYPFEHANTKSLQAAAEKIKGETDGRVSLDIYPAQQLGDYTVVYEEIMRGTIDMGLITVPSTFEPKLEALYLNYLVATFDEAKEIYTPGSTLYATIAELNEAQGVRLLGFYAEGFAGIITTKEIIEPLNFNVDHGVLLRMPPMNIFKLSAGNLNLRTTSIPYEELYVGMQTGVVDGSMGIPVNLAYSNFVDVIKHFYAYNNFFEVTCFLINQEIWDSISPTDQDIIQTIINQTSLDSFEMAEEEEQKSLKLLKDSGVDITTFSSEELNQIAQRNREQVWPELYDQFGEDFIDNLLQQYK